MLLDSMMMVLWWDGFMVRGSTFWSLWLCSLICYRRFYPLSWDFSPIFDNYLFEIKTMIFSSCRCFIFSLCFCFYLVIMEMVSTCSCIGCISNPLESFLCSFGGDIFTIDLLVSIDGVNRLEFSIDCSSVVERTIRVLAN